MDASKIEKPEHILCSAIWYDDGLTRAHLPKNVATGIVACGLRHCNCYTVLVALFPDRSYMAKCKQGFLTSEGRFVDRTAAWAIAVAAGQVIETGLIGEQLFSESMW